MSRLITTPFSFGHRFTEERTSPPAGSDLLSPSQRLQQIRNQNPGCRAPGVRMFPQPCSSPCQVGATGAISWCSRAPTSLLSPGDCLSSKSF